MNRIVFNSASLAERLAAAAQTLADTKPLHQAIGEYMVEATRARFRSSTAPDGTKWQAKRPATMPKRTEP